jgi:2-methylcitrate dehydratase PrpD
MDHTRKLSDFCADLTMDKLPSQVVEKAKFCLLDYVANIYGSLELAAVGRVVEYVRGLGASGPATVLACGFSTDLHHAALVNGTTGEAIESQDGLRFGGNHPGVAVIPAALATAEEKKKGGREVIEAIVAGYEAADRPAAAMHPWHTLKGFLPTGTCGTFGAAAAAAKVRGYDRSLTLNALGNAGYLTPMSMAEHLMGGYTVKIVQGGQAALAGILAADLAAVGLTGTPQVLEGSALKGGFTQITSAADPKFEKLSEGLGEQYSIMDIYFKPYTACRHTHGAAQAALTLLAQHRIDPAGIEAVQVLTYGIAQLAVGKGVVSGDSFVAAQFSIPYVTAAVLLDGELGPRQLTEKRMADPALLALAGRVTVATDEALNAAYPGKTSSRVEITMKSGQTLTAQVDIPKGDPRDPLEAEGLTAKVRAFAGNRDQDRLGRVIDLVLNLEKVASISELTVLI